MEKDYIIKALNNPGKADELLLTKKKYLRPLTNVRHQRN